MQPPLFISHVFFNVSFVLLFYLNLYNNTFLFQLFFYCLLDCSVVYHSVLISHVFPKKIVVSILFFNFILAYAFLFIVYAFIVRNSPLISQSVNFFLSLNLYISYLFTLYLFVCDCYSLYVVFDHCVS